MLGRYRLLELIGEGGCGVVYVAEQLEPVRRHVALKFTPDGNRLLALDNTGQLHVRSAPAWESIRGRDAGSAPRSRPADP